MKTLSQSLKPTPPGWSGSNPCHWTGIACDSSGRVTTINLAGKSLSGNLPANLGQLSALQSLSLQRNRFSGSIPSISDMPDLREIYLGENSFSSIDFPFLSNLPSLQFFSIEDNPLQSWSIPKELSASSSLVEFNVANSGVNGSIPDIFESMTSLKDLRLSYNDITGTFPPSIAKTFLQHFWVNNQQHGISGEIFLLEQITSLEQIWVHTNSFSGPIPNFSNCVSLFDLQLRDNRFTGIIPPSLSNLPKLVNISLQNNRFQGPMPFFGKNVKVTLGGSNSFCLSRPGPCDPQVTALLEIVSAFGYPSVIADSWVGNDACQNWAHVTCNSAGAVIVVNFGKLGWVGTISPAFANLTSLTSILLNDNKLVGTVPDALATLQMLQKVDLSNNNLTGKIPTFSKNVTVVLGGNPFVGTDVDTAGSLSSPPGSGAKNEDDKSGSHLSFFVIAVIIIGVMVLLIVLGFFLYRQFKKVGGVKRSKKEKADEDEDVTMNNPIGFPRGSPSETSSMLNKTSNLFDNGTPIPIEVLRDVTNQFSNENILGRGGSGVVYKGVLQDGTQIAVKRIIDVSVTSTKGKNEFESEIAVLSKVRHRHLVALLGYCVAKNEWILVYEYMSQGTLGQHLFECDKGFSSLTWMQRLVIALDVARGVAYLHSEAQESFIHRDLKPSNILLGDNMRAKVSDFGLVKITSDHEKHTVETRIAGTFGYLAPEYAFSGRVTRKADVFAFGVILMQLITGRKALDDSLGEDDSPLASWFRKMVVMGKDNLRNNLDPQLMDSVDDGILDSMLEVAVLAGHCTARNPQGRPEMSHAVTVLSPLVNQWRPTTEIEAPIDDPMSKTNNSSLPDLLQRWKDGVTTSMTEYSVGETSTAMGEKVQGR
ncbi:receptor-like kinase TMK4 [Silene latifolia]|uniref:receptor-like kinase TMK4 n=1 Tax=Silene latifolia TaxID=37657 RepID=UPI003D774CCE